MLYLNFAKLNLPKMLMPKLCVGSLHQVDPLHLKSKGLRAAMLDLDNTLLPWNTYGLSNEVLEWVDKMRSHDINVCLCSNALPKRIEKALMPLALPYVAMAKKPLLRGFIRGLRLLGARPQECAMIGDQIFTDVLGANRLGMYSIYIQQEGLVEQRWMKGVRKLERWILRRNPRPLDVQRELSSLTPLQVLPEVPPDFNEFES